MTNSKRSILSALLPIGAMFMLGACIDPIIIGGNGNGGSGNGGNPGAGGASLACMTDADCNAGQRCVNGVCESENPVSCNGQPSPVSCTQTGCRPGEVCAPDPDPNACYPSACGCDTTTGMWVCTADCGQGSHCVPAQPCGPNNTCPPDMLCSSDGTCVPVCSVTLEACNAIDDDCDGQVDEQDDPANPLCANGGACVMGQCQNSTIYCMADADCPPMQSCINGVCGFGNGCTTESCNGIDDDCNGVVDDGVGAICADGTVCINGMCGGNQQMCGPNGPPCPAGHVCSATGWCVPGGCMATPEVCNGFDDDCNGVVDDAVPGTVLCPNGGQCVMGSCFNGPQLCGPMNPCPAGQMCTATGVCVSGCMATQEVCNGIDDDCDGMIDEQTAGATLCPNGGQCVMGQCSGTTTQCGPMNPCPAGQTCSPNGVCVSNCMPKPEVCNGIDDDCDNLIDEVTAGATLCPNGGQCVMGQCSGTTTQCGPMNPCPAGQTCTPNGVCVSGCMPAPEVCNGIDDDCDGVIDETAAGTTLCQGGICIAGQCQLVCNSNNNCPAGTLCVNGICQ